MNVRRGDIVLLGSAYHWRRRENTPDARGAERCEQRSYGEYDSGVYNDEHIALVPAGQVLIDVNSPDGKQSGLKQTSVISCENILTVVKADIQRTIGHLPAALMKRVDDSLKFSLGLP
jgi:mRNA interferase MazF